MKKFLLIYHSPVEDLEKMANATPEEKQEGMKPWLAWKESIGNKMVDFGAPLMHGTRILPSGAAETSQKEVTGYSIVEAENMAALQNNLKSHPHLQWGETSNIEVHECISM